VAAPHVLLAYKLQQTQSVEEQHVAFIDSHFMNSIFTAEWRIISLSLGIDQTLPGAGFLENHICCWPIPKATVTHNLLKTFFCLFHHQINPSYPPFRT
jgi:hypothetical protein